MSSVADAKADVEAPRKPPRHGGGGGGPAAAAAGPPPTGLGKEAADSASRQHGVQARLRIEYFTNREAKALAWAVLACTLVILASCISLVVLKFTADEHYVLFESKTWYIVNTAVASATSASLLAVGAAFAYNLRSTRAARQQWSYRRVALCRNAGVMVALQFTCSLFWVMPYALNVLYRCFWFSNTIAWLAFMRWSLYNLFFLWAVTMAHACCRYRGPEPNPDPDEQLVMDCTPRQKLRAHAPMLLVWAPFQALICADLYERLNNNTDDAAVSQACNSGNAFCAQESYVEVFNLIEILVVALYAVAYAFYLLRAFRDHRQLPFARYRLSNLFIRLSARHGVATFLAVVFTLVVLSAVHYESCWSVLDGALGAAPVQLAMALMVAVSAVALMPKHVGEHAVLTMWHQQFAWAEAQVPSMFDTRQEQLRAAHARAHSMLHLRMLSGGARATKNAIVSEAEAAGHALADLVAAGTEYILPGLMRHSKQAEDGGEAPAGEEEGGDGPNGKAEPPAEPPPPPPPAEAPCPAPGAWSRLSSLSAMLRRSQVRTTARPEPVFCLETAIKLFVWSKLAYRYWAGAAGGMSREGAKALLGVTKGFKALRDPQSDTCLILGWSDDTLVMGYRGTASRTNAVTDLKFLRTQHQPHAFHAGVPALVHSGFWRAYSANGNRDTLRGVVQEIVGGFSDPCRPRLLITGHSLGGALAMLAAYDLAQAFPGADLRVVTFGAPRVGNRAFAHLHRARVPHAFQVVNDQDPVPRVPTTGFKHTGLPVLINSRGDILVRPSYFERAVISRTGGAVSDHKIRAYALSMASVVKAQFSSSKWLPGGAAGATALTRAVDLGTALALTHMDLPSLKDPALLPRSCDMGRSRAPKPRKPRASPFSCFGEGASDEAVAEVEAEEGGGAGQDEGSAAPRAPTLGRRSKAQLPSGLREEVVPETAHSGGTQQQQGGEQAASPAAVERSAGSGAGALPSASRWPWRRRTAPGAWDAGRAATTAQEPDGARLQQAEEGRVGGDAADALPSPSQLQL